ncbi:hypothetical protein FB567DRAFT_551384 [Paraphoma chrysanthemicola]|uniref:Peptidase S54 rhomboid domain-containing protein n=1 Tax=Paraphoma chrysanthemicola TaxID=798071 RepID=A0A8K0QR13_9PLEO|nr:hypothetical protein FB567DRAFT_555930 [Paraphoma chrysanthemicola]KAH7082435.1 hypothetical protein FB567DRAFT_551384 [Paraphoma chrysanthemicola]
MQLIALTDQICPACEFNLAQASAGMSKLIGLQHSIIKGRNFTFDSLTQLCTRTSRSFCPASARYLSNSSRSKPNPLPQDGPSKKPAARRIDLPIARKRHIDPSRKATLLLQRLSKTPSAASQRARQSPSPEHKPASPQAAVQENQGPEEASKTIEIDEHEEHIQRKIMKDRTKLLWPGIWTFFALTGTYAGFAYLDARYGSSPVSLEQLPARAKLPQDWFLTPTVIREGIKAGWNELDKLTIGIVVASIAIQLTRKSPLPFWERLMHITGEKKYTAFTYPFVHSSWGHLAQNMFALCWFMPGVVRYLDCDYFHAAALFASVPLITSYLQHFAFRWGPATGVPLNMGSSGAVAAMFGAYCVAYADEKVWLPSFIVVRLDAKYWAILYPMWQLARLMATPKGGNRPAFLYNEFFAKELRCRPSTRQAFAVLKLRNTRHQPPADKPPAVEPQRAAQPQPQRSSSSLRHMRNTARHSMARRIPEPRSFLGRETSAYG